MNFKKAYLKFILLFITFESLSQTLEEVLIINHDIKIDSIKSQIVKKVTVKRNLLYKDLAILTHQAIDSTKKYGGNVFRFTYLNLDEEIKLEKGFRYPDYFRGNIYKVSEDVKKTLSDTVKALELIKKERHLDYLNQLQRNSIQVEFEFYFFEFASFTPYANRKTLLNNIDNNGGLSINLIYLRNFYPLKTNKLILSSGFGLGREYFGFTPNLNLEQTGISNKSSILIYEYNTWDYWLNVPLQFSFNSPTFGKDDLSIKFNAGTRYKYRFHNESKEVIFGDGNMPNAQFNDIEIEKKLLEHYADFIKKNRIVLNFGFTLSKENRVEGGVAFNFDLASRFSNSQPIENVSNIMMFIKSNFNFKNRKIK
jgi:hypothetical protein